MPIIDLRKKISKDYVADVIINGSIYTQVTMRDIHGDNPEEGITKWCRDAIRVKDATVVILSYKPCL